MTDLGVDPSAIVVGVRYVNNNTLLRTRIKGRTQRYIACYDSNSRFKYFREISSSERKRVIQNTLEDNPIGNLDWVLVGDTWSCELQGKPLVPIKPYSLKAPTDYTVYMWGGTLISNKFLKKEIEKIL